MHLICRKTCRVCTSSALTNVIDLGEQYLQGSFIKPGKELPSARKIPTTLVRCDPMRDEKACGLLQMQYSVPPEILYSSYWYRSGTNNTMKNHLRNIAEEAVSILGTDAIRVLDIGCNDGTLLNFYPKKTEKFGIDPSDVAQEISEDITVVQDMFPSRELEKCVQDKKFDVITAIAMFYDLEDPIAFCKSITQLLSTRGIWIFEMSYMPSMLKMNSYDTICHEHLEYYSLAVIEYILKQAGLKIFNVTQNDINGGSICCFATSVDNFLYKQENFIENVKALRLAEFDLELDTDKPYKNFQNRVEKHRDELSQLIRKLRADNKKIHIYGASTKGNTILQWCGLDHQSIEFAAERNPDKYGASTLGTNIPIISEVESRAMNPDYYLVLPWHFRREIVEREQEMLQKGVGFIFPLADIEVIKQV